MAPREVSRGRECRVPAVVPLTLKSAPMDMSARTLTRVPSVPRSRLRGFERHPKRTFPHHVGDKLECCRVVA